MTFAAKLSKAQAANASWLCVGLDPLMDKLPAITRDTNSPLLTFCLAIVEATADLVCAYKPNLAFWLAEGPAGVSALQQLIAHIPRHIPIVLDAKFNDVGHTAAAYARAAFETLGVDGCTANPYLGLDTLRPFLDQACRGVFLLARTSNPSAPDLQDKTVTAGPAGEETAHQMARQASTDHAARGSTSVAQRPLYEEVAHLAVEWNADLAGVCGLVVGATYPEELARLRAIAPELPFLIPGIGAQGGNLAAAVAHGPTSSGMGPLINSSRGIIFASPEADFAQAARAAAQSLRDRINTFREDSA